MRIFLCISVFGWWRQQRWCVWEITHYFIVLVFRGKALLKLSPSFSPLFLSNYIPPSLPAPSFSFLYISTSYFLLCPTFFLSPLHLSQFSCYFSPSLCLTLSFSEAFWESRGRKQLGSQTMEHIKIKKAAPASPTSHTHTHTYAQTQQDKQDIPAAGCTGFLALANLKRRVRLGV